MHQPAGGAAAPLARAGADRRARRTLRRDLIALAVVGVLLVGALASATAVTYQNLYSPTAFVLRYLDLLAQGRAADALALPGVAIDSGERDAAGLPVTASEALLRADALAPLTQVTAIGTEQRDDATAVTVSYNAGRHSGTTTFLVERSGWAGVAPAWRFAQSPLAVIELTVRGAMQFQVNGFPVDKRQVSADGADADPLDPLPLLVFSPGLYSLAVQTPAATTPGVAVLSDSPLAEVPVQLQAEPTPELIQVVQDEVAAFLTACAEQTVLQPTGCPFGRFFQNRVVGDPEWSILAQPTVALVPAGTDWGIRRTLAVAQITVDIQSLRDGSILTVTEEVPFFLGGTVTILPDGTASIDVVAVD
ncbi:hypothetical protein [Microbacterium sp.]|uniref:hypothetical protein n=1 Tax=Microbacterium sp. TaxID=51671 RepID=UPI003A83858D